LEDHVEEGILSVVALSGQLGNSNLLPLLVEDGSSGLSAPVGDGVESANRNHDGGKDSEGLHHGVFDLVSDRVPQLLGLG